MLHRSLQLDNVWEAAVGAGPDWLVWGKSSGERARVETNSLSIGGLGAVRLLLAPTPVACWRLAFIANAISLFSSASPGAMSPSLVHSAASEAGRQLAWIAV